MIGRYADVRAYTSQAPSRLEVLAGDERSEIEDTLGSLDVSRAVGLLEHHYNLLCLDTAAGVLGSAAQGVLDAADQVVIVSPTSLDGARAASSTLDWLVEHGHDGLASSAVAVLNGVTTAPVGSTSKGSRSTSRPAAGPASASRGIPISRPAPRSPSNNWNPAPAHAFLELAAAIACGFTEPTQRRS